MKPHSSKDETEVICDRCGNFRITNSALPYLEGISAKYEDALLKISFGLRKAAHKNSEYVWNSPSLDALAETVLPTPPEQLDNLIYFLGELSPDAGRAFELGEDNTSVVGARNLANLGFIVESAIEQGLVTGYCKPMIDSNYVIRSIKLTIAGWTVYLNLKKGKTDSKQAFMAMKFGDSLLDDIFANHFKDAVQDTGFELKRLDEGQPAGLIDDHLRVEIRKSKFLIADLTHHNNGAYWEAGYAEGLGKHVIYTCRKDVFDDKTNTTHFDTNHHLTVVWQEDKLEDAVKQLKATIRATLPEDAKMEDSLLG